MTRQKSDPEQLIRLRRSPQNPILTPTNHSWESQAVFNCAVTLFHGRIALIYRAQGTDTISRFGLAFSDDGVTIAERSPQPIFEPDPDSPYETLGVEDPRITQIHGIYYMLYTAASHYPAITDTTTPSVSEVGAWRVRVSLAETRDFTTFTRYGVLISHIDSKNAALFPKKFQGNFLVAHRVIPDIRLAVMPDLDHFLERGPILSPRPQTWDGKRVGVAAPPIETPFGWLLIYHGVAETNVYSLGLALLDLHHPAVVLGRTTGPILTPENPYEVDGVVKNVVFSCGAVKWHDQLFVYYGGADQVIGVASVPYSDILAWAERIYHQSGRSGRSKLKNQDSHRL